MKKVIKNYPASIHDRLLNLARSQQKAFNELFYIYANDRFLYRLSLSPYVDKFILKGAMAVLNLQIEKTRYTRDIDLLGFTANEIHNIEQIIREVCEIQIEEDGLTYDPHSVSCISIKLHDDYPGVRVHFNVSLGEGMLTKLQVDIGFGDEVYPIPQITPYRGLLDLPQAMIRVYPTEAILAEKIHAIVKLGLINSRIKDIYDIWLIASSQIIDGNELVKAIHVTFENRQTPFPEKSILFDERFLTTRRNNAWKSIQMKLPPVEDLPEFSETLDRLKIFLTPLFSAVYFGRVFPSVWDPSKAWQWQ